MNGMYDFDLRRMLMKYRLMTALLLVMCLAFSCAAAQTLPDLTTFSPGLTRASDKLGGGERVEMTAELGVKDMLYVRDVSLLQAMLDGMQLTYAGSGTLKEGSDALTLTRGGETIFTAGMARRDAQAEIAVNGKPYGISLEGETWAEMADAGDALAGMAVLDRVPLVSVCEAIEGLAAGDGIAGGLTAVQPFAVERTMSDDGTRLTRINISGSIAREGEAPWAVSGFLRQPAGRSPKDTAEVTFAQDEDNTLTATYSSTRSQSMSQKDKKGRVIVDTSLQLSGKLGGYGVTTKLRVRAQNDWTADGENLSEKLVITVTLGHTDRTPGRRMQRLNDMSAKLRVDMTVKSQETGETPVVIAEASSLSAAFDGNTFLDVSMQGDTAIGGKGESAVLTGAPAADLAQIRAALEEASVRMAQLVYPQLDREAQKKAEKGLE